ncbi:hypothetical protein CkaCkLH20_07694 [Colletotrichum karsti]|uniref:Peptidase M43 pregnancy-associated plasma-A domain-containing protein n=1 Tax=Colletotrichum karsti TaxID=1095194 RepID=A0A9P6I371_9PEZI|nr:uncharacterized protein CkaCkLH20_07694 [Colletotrichum karsti]KAF9875000.1 hypothetical protein CkaCkLH20_07694 [Colletotrichum karsti]
MAPVSPIFTLLDRFSSPPSQQQKQPERLKHVAEKATSNNPSQLGDPVSLKAEVSKLVPTEGEQGAASSRESSAGPTGKGAAGAKNSDGSPVQDHEKKRLKQVAEENMEAGNPSQLGDPVSLKAETSDTEPTGEADGQRREKSKLMFSGTAAALLLFLGASSALMCGNNGTRTAPELPQISLATGYVKGNDSVKPIDVYFHIVSTEANKTMITDAIIDAQFDVLYSTFLRHGFEFNLVNVSRTVDDVWASPILPDDTEDLAWLKATRRGGYDALNLYFFSDMNSESGGFGTNPRILNATDGGWSFYADGCMINGGTMPGMSPRLYNDTGPHKGHVAIHEVGHWFDLEHTFEGGCDDEDGVADTPAQNGWVEGFECPEGRNSCPDRPGLDPLRNFMNYGKDSCMAEFTLGQEERMHQRFTAYRRPLIL